MASSLVAKKPNSQSAAVQLTEDDIPGAKLQVPLESQPYSGGFYVVALRHHQTGESHS